VLSSLSDCIPFQICQITGQQTDSTLDCVTKACEGSRQFLSPLNIIRARNQSCIQGPKLDRTEESKVSSLIEAWRNIRRALNFKSSRSLLPRRRSQRDLFSYSNLEPRQLLAAITVSTLVDEVVDNDTTSLREALVIASETDGTDTIDFASSLFGSLVVDSDVEINGPGANVLTINGTGLASGDHVFKVSDSVVTLSGLRIVGNGSGVSSVLVTSHDGDLTIIDSEISNNAQRGIFFAGNNGASGPLSLRVINSTISGNQSAIFARADADNDVNFELTNSTIVNSSLEGVRVERLGSSVVNANIFNTIIAGNNSRDFRASAGTLGQSSSAFSNLIGSSSVGIFSGQTGIEVEGLQLQSLSFNGGSTRSHAIGVESLALDAGNANLASRIRGDLALSQNKVQRALGESIDIGAFERSAITQFGSNLEISTGAGDDVIELLEGENGFSVSVNGSETRQVFSYDDVSKFL